MGVRMTFCFEVLHMRTKHTSTACYDSSFALDAPHSLNHKIPRCAIKHPEERAYQKESRTRSIYAVHPGIIMGRSGSPICPER